MILKPALLVSSTIIRLQRVEMNTWSLLRKRQMQVAEG